jgi:hypothetical protein
MGTSDLFIMDEQQKEKGKEEMNGLSRRLFMKSF